MTNIMNNVPSEITERFLPQERPRFRLIRTIGTVKLWRSKTVAHECQGYRRPARVHFHISVGESADIVLMPRIEAALANFDLAVAECAVVPAS